MSKINEFKKITESMANTYECKNIDYGDSFGESFEEFGLISSVVRMNDKMNRLKSFVNNGDYQNQITSKDYQTSSQVQQTVDNLQIKFTQSGGYNVKDESIKDTLLDLANYCIMTVIELNNQAQK